MLVLRSAKPCELRQRVHKSTQLKRRRGRKDKIATLNIILKWRRSAEARTKKWVGTWRKSRTAFNTIVQVHSRPQDYLLIFFLWVHQQTSIRIGDIPLLLIVIICKFYFPCLVNFLCSSLFSTSISVNVSRVFSNTLSLIKTSVNFL